MIKLPKECEVNKFIPKKIFYKKVNISSLLKQEFIDKLEKITWKYKLSEDNINIPKTENIEEIEIFEIILKEKYNAKGIIKVITKEIQYPILFEIKYKNEFQYAVRFNDDIFITKWNKEKSFKFSGLNLEKVYENIVETVAEIKNEGQNINEKVEKSKRIENIKKEIEKLENKMKNEKQFNRKVELNRIINELTERLKNV